MRMVKKKRTEGERRVPPGKQGLRALLLLRRLRQVPPRVFIGAENKKFFKREKASPKRELQGFGHDHCQDTQSTTDAWFAPIRRSHCAPWRPRPQQRPSYEEKQNLYKEKQMGLKKF